MPAIPEDRRYLLEVPARAFLNNVEVAEDHIHELALKYQGRRKLDFGNDTGSKYRISPGNFFPGRDDDRGKCGRC